MASDTTGLSPEDINYFDTARRRLGLNYQQGSAQNAYQQGVLGQQQASGLDALNNRYNQLRNQLPGGYAQRGLLNSGIYQQGLQQYAQNRQTDLNNVQQQYQQQLGGLQLGQQQLDQQNTGGLGDIEAQQAARRQAIAAALRSAL